MSFLMPKMPSIATPTPTLQPIGSPGGAQRAAPPSFLGSAVTADTSTNTSYTANKTLLGQ